ncbi:TonB-dependent receptor domain-containing protein, partial [Capnocytophaga leadbetteri]|uniref:TonB-dependent receptor domain-containing protein n=1 Tax=Capnocytophaga leadbetteri TaxID=327575 RepID=UPI0028D4E5DB
YAMVSGSFNKRENFVLSKDFEPTRTQPEYIRRHAETFDKKIRAKIGYTPNKTDEYTLGIVTQQAHKDISPNVNGGIFRDYPIYNKNSLYLKSKTLIAPKTFANFTGYYDTYYNQMNAYDNDKYQTINNGFSSIYDDYSLGGILTFSTEYFKYNALSLSINEKYNHHKEHDREIAANPSIGQHFKAGTPVQNMKDNVLYIGLEDVITFNKYFSAVVGAAYNQQQNIIAEKYGTRTRGGTPELYAFDKGSDYAFDYKAGVVISAADNHNITISIAKRSRFASQKERYSERLGAAIPNPDLKSEYARVYDLTYTSRILNNKLQYEVSGFINEVKDAIYAKPVEIRAGVLRSQNINIANATYRGVEAALSYSPNQYLTVGGHYSFIEMKDQSDDNDEKFTDIPAFKLVGFATFSIPQLKTALHLNTETSAKRDLGKDRRGNPIGYAPEYTVLNAKLSVMLYKGLEANFGVNNLFDRNYYLTIGYPQEGRNFITGLSYNF